MQRPIISTERAIVFKRVYENDSGGPEYQRGSTRAEVVSFETLYQKRLLAKKIVNEPGFFAPYLAGSICRLRVVPGEAMPYAAVEFSRSVAINEQLRDTEMPLYETHIEARGRNNETHKDISMTFDVSGEAELLNLALWVEAKLFDAFVHPNATIRYTAITATREPSPVSPPYHVVHGLANRISPPFVTSAATFPFYSPNNGAHNNGAHNNGAHNNTNEVDDDDDDDSLPRPEVDDDDLDTGIHPPVATPRVSATDNGGLELIRRVSDELFEVRHHMPEAAYLRLSNALKRDYDEALAD